LVLARNDALSILCYKPANKFAPRRGQAMSTRIALITSLCLLSANLWSAEVDHFNTPTTKLVDSLPKINHQSNSYLAEAIYEANAEGRCDEDLLYKRMRKRFHNHIKGDLVPWMNEIEEVEGQRVHNTIYREYKWYQSIVLGLVYRIGKAPMGYIVNLGGKYYGTDKFEHFFGKGFSYFTKYYKEGKSIDHILDYGAATENGLLGASMTGVYSYGDLGANFNGMRFWNHVLQKNDDILGKKYNAGPYVRCQQGQWRKVKSIDWSLYFDQSFSEGHNCSKFRTKSLYNKAVAQVKALSERSNADLSCPYKDVNMGLKFQKVF
jgi:hypothetical protein